MRSAFISLISFASIALGNIAPTSPVASTVCIGGVICTVSWIDSSAAPAASAFGRTSIGLFVGNTLQQTQVQALGEIANPSRVTEANYTIDATAGPDGNYYFVRFQSLAATDAAGTPLQAFSAQFSLAGMTGQLSAEALAQVAGISLTPSALSPTSASSTSASTVIAAQSSLLAVAASSSSGGLPQTNVFAAAAPSATSGAEHQTVGLSVVLIACVLTLYLLP